MRTFKQASVLALALFLCSLLRAAETPALDAARYPQNTPQAAFGSIIKAQAQNDVAYWLSWLITPADKERLLKKYGSVDKVVEKHRDPKFAARIAEQCAIMKKMLAANKVTEGETGGVKWARFAGAQTPDGKTRVLQLNKQADGRWVWSLLVHSDNDPAAPPPPAEKK